MWGAPLQARIKSSVVVVVVAETHCWCRCRFCYYYYYYCRMDFNFYLMEPYKEDERGWLIATFNILYTHIYSFIHFVYCRNIISFTVLYANVHTQTHLHWNVFSVVSTNILHESVCVATISIWSIIFNHLQAHKINSKLKWSLPTKQIHELTILSLLLEENENEAEKTYNGNVL